MKEESIFKESRFTMLNAVEAGNVEAANASPDAEKSSAEDSPGVQERGSKVIKGFEERASALSTGDESREKKKGDMEAFSEDQIQQLKARGIDVERKFARDDLAIVAFRYDQKAFKTSLQKGANLRRSGTFNPDELSYAREKGGKFEVRTSEMVHPDSNVRVEVTEIHMTDANGELEVLRLERALKVKEAGPEPCEKERLALVKLKEENPNMELYVGGVDTNGETFAVFHDPSAKEQKNTFIAYHGEPGNMKKLKLEKSGAVPMDGSADLYFEGGFHVELEGRHGEPFGHKINGKKPYFLDGAAAY